MCLILLAYRQHPLYPLVLIANRDEFFQRPTQFAQYWHDAPHILGGRDLNKNGTWLAVDRQGRFAAVTNYRDKGDDKVHEHSRGNLISDYLQQEQNAYGYVNGVISKRDQYAGFNLLVGDPASLYFLSSRAGQAEALQAGVYALSNAELDSPWPKAEKGRAELLRELNREVFPDKGSLFSLLADTTIADDEALPETGLSPEWERKLSSVFVRGGDYGTRASTILTVSHEGEVDFTERNFDAEGKRMNTQHYQFYIKTAGMTL